jgi:TolA-binding protein
MALEYYRNFLETSVHQDYLDNAAYGIAWSLLNLGKTQEALQQFQQFFTSDHTKSDLLPSALFQVGAYIIPDKSAARRHDGI